MIKRGLTARNWIRLECVSENWEEYTARASPPGSLEVEECHAAERPISAVAVIRPVEGGNAMCVAQDVKQAEEWETELRMRITQDIYAASMNYA